MRKIQLQFLSIKLPTVAALTALLGGCQALMILPFLPNDVEKQAAICKRNQFAITHLHEPSIERILLENGKPSWVKNGWCVSRKISLRPLWIEDLRNISTYYVFCDDVVQNWVLVVKRGQEQGTKDKQFASISYRTNMQYPSDTIYEKDSAPYFSSMGFNPYCNLPDEAKRRAEATKTVR